MVKDIDLLVIDVLIKKLVNNYEKEKKQIRKKVG